MIRPADPPERVAVLVQDAPVARLATVRPDGRPHLVPITFALTGPTLVTAVDDKPKRSTALQRLFNLAAFPAVTVLVDHFDPDDWSRLWWVRLDGTARVVRDEPERSQLLGPLVEKYPQYAHAAPSGPVIDISIRAWRWWFAAGDPP